VTTFFLQHEIDTGNILFQEKVAILPEDNLGSLYEKLMGLGADLVLRTVAAIATKDIHPLPQDEALAIHKAPKIFKETGKIDWAASATSIHNLIRGLSPYPGAWTEIQGKTCKIFTSTTLEGSLAGKAPGEWASDFKTYLHFQCGQGILVVQELQLEGKKRMKVDELLRGWK
jgi:methionyl-tRNA formyltransferase